jgi:hypothetical protein
MFRTSGANNNYTATPSKFTRMYTAIFGIFSYNPPSSNEIQKTIETCKKEHNQFSQLIQETNKINSDCENDLKKRL